MTIEDLKKEWQDHYWKKQEMLSKKRGKEEQKELARISARMNEIMVQIIGY